MTPKEKALQLLWKYDHVTDDVDKGTTCALMAVDEVLEELDHLPFDDQDFGTFKMKYWQEVKREIEKL